MRRSIMFFAILLVAPIATPAQNSHPKAELFGGFSYLNSELGDHEGSRGWGASVAVNLTRNVGIVGEFTGNYGKVLVPGFEIGGFFAFAFKTDSSMHTFMFGPRFSSRRNKITVFAHTLAGVARRRLVFGRGVIVGGDVNDLVLTSFRSLGPGTGFAMTIGGGLDLNAGKHLAVRIFQVDYLPTALPTNFVDSWSQNGRAMAGVVFRF